MAFIAPARELFDRVGDILDEVLLRSLVSAATVCPFLYQAPRQWGLAHAPSSQSLLFEVIRSMQYSGVAPAKREEALD